MDQVQILAAPEVPEITMSLKAPVDIVSTREVGPPREAEDEEQKHSANRSEVRWKKQNTNREDREIQVLRNNQLKPHQKSNAWRMKKAKQYINETMYLNYCIGSQVRNKCTAQRSSMLRRLKEDKQGPNFKCK